jgi:hypothetical protein
MKKPININNPDELLELLIANQSDLITLNNRLADRTAFLLTFSIVISIIVFMLVFR